MRHRDLVLYLITLAVLIGLSGWRPTRWRSCWWHAWLIATAEALRMHPNSGDALRGEHATAPEPQAAGR